MRCCPCFSHVSSLKAPSPRALDPRPKAWRNARERLNQKVFHVARHAATEPNATCSMHGMHGSTLVYISIHNSRTRARRVRSTRALGGSGNSRNLEKTEVGATVASKTLEDGPRRPQDALKSSQEASRRPQERSKGPQDAFKSTPRRFKTAPRALKKPQDGPKSVPRGVKTAPRAFQEASRRPKSAPDGLKTAPRALQEASRRLKASSSLCEATRRHSKCAFKITFEEDVRRSVRSSCSFPLSSIRQAAGQPAPCILCTGSL